MIVGIPIPHNFSMNWESVKSLLALNGRYPITYVEGPYIYMNRNELISRARKANESLLMIDSDMVFKPDDVDLMADYVKKYPAITGGVFQYSPSSPGYDIQTH